MAPILIVCTVLYLHGESNRKPFEDYLVCNRTFFRNHVLSSVHACTESQIGNHLRIIRFAIVLLSVIIWMFFPKFTRRLVKPVFNGNVTCIKRSYGHFTRVTVSCKFECNVCLSNPEINHGHPDISFSWRFPLVTPSGMNVFIKNHTKNIFAYFPPSNLQSRLKEKQDCKTF